MKRGRKPKDPAAGAEAEIAAATAGAAIRPVTSATAGMRIRVWHGVQTLAVVRIHRLPSEESAAGAPSAWMSAAWSKYGPTDANTRPGTNRCCIAPIQKTARAQWDYQGIAQTQSLRKT